MTQFGKQFRKNHFTFPDEVTPLNHGSFGAAPRRVIQAQDTEWHSDLSFPDRYYFHELQQKMKKSAQLIGNLVNTDYENIALVPNATTGVNVVFGSFPFKDGDTIVMTSIIYGACGNICDFMVNKLHINLKVIDITFPRTQESILDKFDKVLSTTEGTTVCIYDVICSMPGIRMPFEKITQICHKYNAVSVIDGAHSIGMLPIDLTALGADFFVSNIHKWMYVPRPCGMLYVNPKYQDFVLPLPISHGYKETPFFERFLFYGSANYSSFFVIPEALKFVEEDCGGFDKIREYCGGLVEKLRAHFGDLVVATPGIGLNFLVCVKVPLDSEQSAYLAEHATDSAFEKEFHDYVCDQELDNYHTWTQFHWHNGFLYVRLSCQIYVDYEELIWGYELFEKIAKTWLTSTISGSSAFTGSKPDKLSIQ